MIYAATPEEIETRRKAFIRKWRLKCRAVADSLEEAGDHLFTFTRLPPTSGEAQEQRTRSSVCTKSSSGGLRRRPCCRRPIRRQCCSGRCSPLVKSTCARLTVGRPSPPHNKAINRLTSPPDSVLSKCWRSRQHIPTQFATAPEAAVIQHFQERMPYGLFVPDEPKHGETQ